MIIESKKHERNYPIVLFFISMLFIFGFSPNKRSKSSKKVSIVAPDRRKSICASLFLLPTVCVKSVHFYSCSRRTASSLYISILAPDGLRQIRAFLFLLTTICVKSVRFYSCSRRSASSLCKKYRLKNDFEAICTCVQHSKIGLAAFAFDNSMRRSSDRNLELNAFPRNDLHAARTFHETLFGLLQHRQGACNGFRQWGGSPTNQLRQLV